MKGEYIEINEYEIEFKSLFSDRLQAFRVRVAGGLEEAEEYVVDLFGPVSEWGEAKKISSWETRKEWV